MTYHDNYNYDVENIYVAEANSGNELKSYGGYYTYNAATAGTGASVISRNENAPSSICPKGWRLPTGGSGGEFKALNDALGSITNSDAHLINPDGPAFLRAGYYYNGSASGQGSYGYYWSSKAYDSTYAYILSFSRTSVSPTAGSYSGYRYHGSSVRCVAAEQYSISYNLTGGSAALSSNPQTGSSTKSSITLDSTIPISDKCGYAFQYWCSVDNTADPTTCSGAHYDAGASYDLSNGTYPTLYAVWKKPTIGTDLGDLGTMQSFVCTRTMSIGSFGTVTDARDGNTYCVRKLADGQCWMTSNLRLGDSKLENHILTSDNTDLNGKDTYTLPNSNKKGFLANSNTIQNIYVVEADDGIEAKAYGGYYTWNAATAGTGSSATSDGTNASSSICPKGWRLLKSSSVGGEFKTLNDALGGATDSSAHMTNPDGPAFLLSGSYLSSSGGGSASGQDFNSDYWSSTSYRSPYVYNLTVYSGGVSFDSHYMNRQCGNSIRCIARDLYVQYSISYNLNGGTSDSISSPQTGETFEGYVNLSGDKPTREGYSFVGWCSVNNTVNPLACSGKTYDANAAYPLSEGATTTLYAVWKFDVPSMQDWKGCSSLATNGTVALGDLRDGNIYHVRKLKDNICWMIDNIRLGNSSQSIKLTPDDTDLNGINSYTLPRSSKTGFSSNTAQNLYIDGGTYGGYYTYNAATAGTGSSATSDGTNASSSICPKGWRLPTGGENSEFDNLNKAYGGITSSDKHLLDPEGPAFVYAGYYYRDGSAHMKDSQGFYWSSTSHDSSMF